MDNFGKNIQTWQVVFLTLNSLEIQKHHLKWFLLLSLPSVTISFYKIVTERFCHSFTKMLWGLETFKINEKRVLPKTVKSFYHSLMIYTQRAFYHSLRSWKKHPFSCKSSNRDRKTFLLFFTRNSLYITLWSFTLKGHSIPRFARERSILFRVNDQIMIERRLYIFYKK